MLNIQGTTKFKADIEKVWDALHDPEILKQVIPGCQSLEQKEDGEFDIVMKLGVAAVKGEYTGKARLEDLEKPHKFILHAEGSGAPGHVKAEIDCTLTPTDKGCELEWKCDAVIGGLIASVGNRVISGVAKFLAGKFFKDIEKHIK